MRLAEPSPENEHQRAHATLLLESFQRVVGRALLPAVAPPAELARRLYDAPFAVLSHDGSADPVFDYGNRTAQALFAMAWAELTTLPSRLSAEPLARGERERLLAEVTRVGFVDDYQGVRVARDGRRFRIERATVWNLLGPDGARVGQAAAFSRWSPA